LSIVRKIKTFGLLVWIAVLFLAIGYIFWYYEVKYSLPTPVPSGYVPVNKGKMVDLDKRFGRQFNGKPVFIHFFNPDCPCSRFNLKHVNGLIRNYKDRIDFAVVVLDRQGAYTANDIQDKLDHKIPVSFDSTLAGDCGVYATPQAVVLDAEHRIYYKGNYNKSRYCTDKNTNYAQMALDSFLNNHLSEPVFGPYALKAYGCQLPVCSKP
jgi:hypothetical protein